MDGSSTASSVTQFRFPLGGGRQGILFRLDGTLPRFLHPSGLSRVEFNVRLKLRARLGLPLLYRSLCAVKVLLALLRSTLTVLAPREEVRIGSRRGISRSLSLSGSRYQLVKPQILLAIGRSEKCDSKVLQSRIRLFDQIV